MKRLLLLLALFISTHSGLAYHNPDPPLNVNKKNQTNFRSSCEPPRSQKDIAVNTIRARLTSGGDMWWDGQNAGLIIPNVKPGETGVAAIFAAGVWMGGVDEGGNLKLAAQTYGRPLSTDFWPGPLSPLLDPTPGVTNAEQCRNWDQIFSVSRTEIDEHLRNFNQALNEGTSYTIEQVPQNVLGWPAKGNPFFSRVNGFNLPEGDVGLAGFFDWNGDGIYNPLEGDFPKVSLRSCHNLPLPDEINFWIFNDNGNIHAQSQGDPMQMEIQAEAFAYATNDQFNRTLFHKYKLINRAIEPLDSAYFSLWVDPDLGCFNDDYFGCDPGRSLAYIYNEDAIDGGEDCTCPQDINTYCEEIPIVGIDFIRGPLGPKKIGPDGSLQNPAVGEAADTIVELGMSSFTYYVNAGVGKHNFGMVAPYNAQQYYNYMTGSWRDGRPFEYGGDGYYEGTYEVNYAFADAPSDTLGWSLCTAWQGEPLSNGKDRRFIQSTGPFRLDPGGVNEVLIALTWVPDQRHPCPDVKDIQAASDYIQKAFDACFEDLIPGPDAPDMDIVELDQELILILSNDTILTASNNAYEAFEEIGYYSLCFDSTTTDTFYNFEGYKIFQLAGPDVAVIPDNTTNPDLARIVAQVDIKNGIGKIFNWETIGPEGASTGEPYHIPVLMVDGQDEGIKHTFRITEDAFAEGDRRLINHKKYYYAAVAYAHNEWKVFNPHATVPLGQKTPYLQGRRNIGPLGDARPYTAIPRPITNQMLNASFGEGAIITRLDGLGTGANFLELSSTTRQQMEEAFAINEAFTDKLVYADGNGPLDVQIFSPLDIIDGTFELSFVDAQPDDDLLQSNAYWQLRQLEDPTFSVMAEKSIDDLNEQLIRKYGFSITVGQVPEPGTAIDVQNGFIGFDVEVEGQAQNWISFIPEGTDFSTLDIDNFLFDYFMTEPGQVDDDLDPDGGLSQFGDFAFMPYYLLGYEQRDLAIDYPFLGPVHAQKNIGDFNRTSNKPAYLNNVDIVFTSDKSLWSRCVIVETANRFYDGLQEYNTQAYTFNGQDIPATQFDLRPLPSVGKEADTDGLPQPDGAIDEDGNPLYGMGWFPGYAVDVETGQRLNIFFGENSIYDGNTLTDSYLKQPTGGDMMFNPTSEVILNGLGIENLPLPYVLGGHHCVYVTRDPYDGCAAYVQPLKRKSASDNGLQRLQVIRQITWAGLLLTNPDVNMLSYEEGLIPSEVRVKLRVNNAYQVERDIEEIDGDQRTGTGENNYHPKYQFSFQDKAPVPVEAAAQNEILDAINIVPNPYYAYSDYETSRTEGVVKITNLPNKGTVSIYSLDGRFVRQLFYDGGSNLAIKNSKVLRQGQGIPDLEWDLKNVYGTTISSGIYLFHINAEGIGERTLKWFAVNKAGGL